MLQSSNGSAGETDLFEDPKQMNQMLHKIIHCFESLESPAAQNSVNATGETNPNL